MNAADEKQIKHLGEMLSRENAKLKAAETASDSHLVKLAENRIKSIQAAIDVLSPPAEPASAEAAAPSKSTKP